ncbi:MAG: hypothetical protein ACRDSG_02210 [Pseudonocardiaceae bacterium]
MPEPTLMSQLFLPDVVTNFRRGLSVEDVAKDLGVLGDLVGTWMGSGFTLISLPAFDPRPPNDGARKDFRVVANATREILEVEPIGASFPNRGSFKEVDSPFGQPDIEIYGVRYHQRVTDAENNQPLHMESGFWLKVPKTDIPDLRRSLVRQAVIPHGDSLLALGPSSLTYNGKPRRLRRDGSEGYEIGFDPVSPFPVEHATGRPDFNVGYLHDFVHPDEHSSPLARFSDLIVDVEAPPAPAPRVLNANRALELAIKDQDIERTTTLKVSAKNPDKPKRTGELEKNGEAGESGKYDDILSGKNDDILSRREYDVWSEKHKKDQKEDPHKDFEALKLFENVAKGWKEYGRIASIPFLAAKNADVTEFESTFWVEAVKIKDSRETFLQLQYSQLVVLDFLGADWPHISVATLIKQ